MLRDMISETDIILLMLHVDSTTQNLKRQQSLLSIHLDLILRRGMNVKL